MPRIRKECLGNSGDGAIDRLRAEPGTLNVPAGQRNEGLTRQMTRFRGEGASRGIAIGPVHVVAAKIAVAERRILRQDRAAEVAHLEEGISAADGQLDTLQRQLADRKGAGADLVQAHRLMLRSPEVA